MSEFSFKVPALPEDSLFRRRRPSNNVRPDNENIESGRSGNTIFNRRNVRTFHALRPINELSREVQPSTSHGDTILNSSDKINVFQSSLDSRRNQTVMGTNGHDSMSVLTMDGHASARFSSKAVLPGVSHSVLGCRAYNGDINSLHNADMSSFMKFRVQNPQQMNPILGNGLYQNISQSNLDFTRNTNVQMDGSSSSFPVQKSIFNTGLLPKRNKYQTDVSMSHFGNEVSQSVNRTSVIQRDITLPFNISQRVLQNQSMMTSFMQTSVKEQVMNALENCQHSLILNNAPSNLKILIEQTAKKVKGIFEESMAYINSDLGTNDMMSTLFASETSGFPQKSTMDLDTQICPPSKVPKDIIKSYGSKHNETHSIQFTRTFIEEKKSTGKRAKLIKSKQHDKNLSSGKIQTKTQSKEADKQNDEVNLTNWYPVVTDKGLTFIGTSDKNIQCETGTVKKRIDSRRLLLSNGVKCNLIGSLSSDKDFPTSISEKLKSGLDRNWRVLTNKIRCFQRHQRSTKGKKTPKNDIPNKMLEKSSPRKKSRLPSTFLNMGEICDLVDFASPKAANKSVDKVEVSQNKKQKSTGVDKSKRESLGGRARTYEGYIATPQKKNETSHCSQTEEKCVREDKSSRIWTTTRFGRTVKRPGALWTGDCLAPETGSKNDSINVFSGKNTKSTSLKNDTDKASSELKRKRIKLDKTVVEMRGKNKRQKSESKTSSSTGNCELEKLEESSVTTKNIKTNPKGKTQVKHKWKSTDNPWGNEVENGLDDIMIPEISSNLEEVLGEQKKLKTLSMETPPLKYLRSNLRILKNCTPIQSPDWQTSQRTQSEVKKFERLRAQTFKQKIPREKNKSNSGKTINRSARNKDVETVVNWISEREVKSPKQCSKLIKYVLPNRSELENEDDDDDDK